MNRVWPFVETFFLIVGIALIAGGVHRNQIILLATGGGVIGIYKWLHGSYGSYDEE